MDDPIIAFFSGLTALFLFTTVALNLLVGEHILWLLLIAVLALVALEVRRIMRKRQMVRIQEKLERAERQVRYTQLMARAHRHLQDDEPDEALDLYNQAMGLTERKWEMVKRYEEAGDRLMALGDYDKAKVCFRKAEEFSG